jgi:hypothetical protein
LAAYGEPFGPGARFEHLQLAVVLQHPPAGGPHDRMIFDQKDAHLGHPLTTEREHSRSELESSPENPYADANGNIQVSPGNKLPGIPAHLLKVGFEYKVTDQWRVGATGVAASGQYLFGDEANLTAKLPGYFVVGLNSSYQVTKHVQLFGLLQNASNGKIYLYGTFSPTSTVTFIPAPGTTNTRSCTASSVTSRGCAPDSMRCDRRWRN